MFLHRLYIKKFRCFSEKTFHFDKQFTVITGNNGAGKTSLAEAIHYLCYIKSFRSSSVNDLVHHESDSFFIKGEFDSKQDLSHMLQVGYAGKKKSIKLNNKPVGTYKEIFDVFQVITLLEDDINLIRGYPTERRSFIDQAALFIEPQYLDLYRNFKKILQSRNSLLQSFTIDSLEYEVWTEKLWKSSIEIQKHRKKVLSEIESVINDLLATYFDNVYTVKITYESKYLEENEGFNSFYKRINNLIHQERAMKRSLFGSHLDDFSVALKGKKARFFASRGQQKLVSLLCKLSIVTIGQKKDFSPIIIIDDFIADFDKSRLDQLIDFFSSCKNQIIITTPFYDQELSKIIQKVDPEVLSII